MRAATLWIVWASLAAGEPPPPHLEPGEDPSTSTPTSTTRSSAQGSVEGPVRPPEPDPPGIEFAPADPEPEVEADVEAEAQADPWAVPPPSVDEDTRPASEPTELWPDPADKAPNDGSGVFMAGALLLPATAVWTYLLQLNPDLTRNDRRNIYITSGALGALGLSFFAVGGVRQAKLRRWAAAYRVVPTRQGGALLTLGGLGMGLGLTGLPVGIYFLARGSASGIAPTAIGAVSLGLLAPLGIYFGLQRRHAYVETGGWVRRPLPQVQLAPTVLMTNGALGLGVAGRF